MSLSQIQQLRHLWFCTQTLSMASYVDSPTKMVTVLFVRINRKGRYIQFNFLSDVPQNHQHFLELPN